MKRPAVPGFLRQFVRIITFVDLPINRKFFLFAVGVLFWFLVMSAVTTFALFTIDYRYDRIVHQAIPHERVAQKIARNLRAIGVEAGDIVATAAAADVVRHGERAQAYLEDIRAFSSALALGGEVSDVSRDSNRVIESFITASVSDSPEGIEYLRELGQVTEEIGKAIDALVAARSDQLESWSGAGADPSPSYERLRKALTRANELSLRFSAATTALYQDDTTHIQTTIRYTLAAVVAVLLVAMLLLGVFTHWIADSIAQPIRSIIRQIHSLGTGDVDLTQRIAITSKDEIGTLSSEFNTLMEAVYGMTSFKNVIEEDVNLVDIYSRLGAVFEREAKISHYCIYEIKDNQRDMQAVFPLGLADHELHCRPEILHDCELCRARKTGHQISSLAYPGVCLQFAPQDATEQHICMPLNIGGRIGGVVQFLFRPEPGASLDLHAVQARMFKAEAYIKQSLSVLEAKRLLNTLRESALKDALTGLYNRRFLQDHAEHLIAGVKRRQKTIGLLMCDLDYFKQVNDQYGHETGDHLLRETSTVIARAVREADLVIRFGGEEFLVLLLDVQEGEAVRVAEKIRVALAETGIRTSAGILSKTISIGVSEFPGDTDAFWQGIKYADVALYRAKETGRNKVVRFSPEMWSGEQF